jgi:hypothetical protein
MEQEMTNPTNNAAIPNLRETRKQMAKSRQAHPAGKAQPKPAAKAPPKKAPAKKAAPAKPATPKVRWTRLEDKTGAVEQDARLGDHLWEIRRADGGWHVTQDGKRLTETPVPYAQAGRLVLDAARTAVAA